MDYTILRFDETRLHFLPRPQQPFAIIGRLVPRFDGQMWSLSEELLDTPREKTYPDDRYDPMEYIDNPDQAVFLAMDEEECVGSIRVCKRWNGNAFIDDLAVDRAHRGQGIGRRLMDAAVKWGRENKLHGVSLETQDWNLLACRFYLLYGFQLGGIDCRVYDKFETRSETALYFYLLPGK